MTIFNFGYFQAKVLNGFQQEQEQHIDYRDLAIKYDYVVYGCPLKCSHFFVLGSGTSRKRKRRKEALQHLAANDCRQSIGELRDLSMGNSIDGSLLDDHTTPVKKGSASNLLQVNFFWEHSKFKLRE